MEGDGGEIWEGEGGVLGLEGGEVVESGGDGEGGESGGLGGGESFEGVFDGEAGGGWKGEEGAGEAIHVGGGFGVGGAVCADAVRKKAGEGLVFEDGV